MRVTMATAAARAGDANEDFAGAVPAGAVLVDGAGIEAITGSCSASELTSMVLLSNGASRIVDRFRLARWTDVPCHGRSQNG